MKRKTFKIIGFVLFVICFSKINLFAEEGLLSCDVKSTKDLLSVQTEQHYKEKEQLNNFLSGNFISEFNLSNLFSIDLEKQDEVRTLLKELSNFSASRFEILYPQCSDNKAELLPLFNKLENLKKEIVDLKIKFLQLPIEHRQILIKISQEAALTNKVKTILRDEQSSAMEEQKSAIEAIKIAEKISEDSDQEIYKKIAQQMILISNLRTKVANLTLAYSQAFEKELNNYQTYNEKLSNYANILTKKNDNQFDIDKENYKNDYDEIVTIWRNIIDRGLFSINSSFLYPGDQSIDIPEKIIVPENQMKSNVYLMYTASYDKFIKNNQELKDSKNKRNQELIEKHYTVLFQASSLRSEFIQLLQINNQIDFIQFNVEHFKDIIREIKIVPYKFVIIFMNKWVEFKYNLSEGLEGVFKIIKAAFILFLLIVIPFFVGFIIKQFSKYLEKFRRSLLKVKRPGRIRIKLSLAIKTITPYFPYIIGLYFLSLADSIMQGTIFEEFRIILPYIKIFIYYRLFFLIFQSGFKKIIVMSNNFSLFKNEYKIKKTAKAIGLYFFFAFFMLHSAESTVGKAFIYFIIKYILYVIGLFVFFITAYRWRKETDSAIQSSFNNAFGSFLFKLSQKPISIFLSPLFLFLLVFKVIFSNIWKRIYELDLAKKAIARILRSQMKAAGAEIKTTDIETLPENYRLLFSFGIPKQDDIWIEPHNKDLDRCRNIIKQWADDKIDEITLAIYGEKGIGKSSLLEKLSKENIPVKDDLGDYNITFIKSSVPPKIITSEGAVSFFQDTLSIDLKENIETIIEWDKTARKTVLLLDDAHNFFVGEIGGFEGFRTFLDLVNLRLDNLFICATFNIHSWVFLDGVFARNKNFRSVIEMSPWTEGDIRDLILIRNSKSEYKLKYDPVISASTIYSESESLENTEKRYFRLLWEQANGNPRTAIYSWLTSVSPRNNILLVGLPQLPEQDIFKDIQPDSLFIYASIIKHENLHLSEVLRATEMPKGVVRYALKIGIERDFLFRSEDGRYRINPAWHAVVINYLSQRNLLYVN